MQINLLICLIYLLTATTTAQNSVEKIVVNTDNGAVSGSVDITLLHLRKFYSFRGIPYAQPPVGELRFKNPQKAKPWAGVRDTTEYGPKCLQTAFNYTHFWGQEDCLYLNVFTPNVSAEAKLPVIFYIHAGGYMSGGAHWMGPEILLNENVVLVTINYRLGPFGFLSLHTSEYSGNMGLKDQILALKWVNENIHNFGGDKSKITLYGHSAGASSVNFHLLLPASRNLFKRAIMASGCVLNPWSYNRKNHTQMLKQLLAQERSIPEESITLNDIIEWIKTVDGKKFGVRTFAPVYTSGKSIKEVELLWAPVIENELHEGSILTKSIELYFTDKTDVDTLFGYTSAESIILAPNDINNPEDLKTFDNNFEVQLPTIDLNYNYSSKEYKDIIKEVRKFYFGERAVDKNSLNEFAKLLTDVFFIYGIDKMVKIQAARSTGNTFLYQFSVELELNYLRKAVNASELNIKGATHLEDMLYLFHADIFIPDDHAYDKLTLDSKEAKVINDLCKFIMNFVNTGNPMPNGDPVDLKPVQNDVVNYVDITNNGFVAGVNPHANAIAFWDSFLKKHKNYLKPK